VALSERRTRISSCVCREAQSIGQCIWHPDVRLPWKHKMYIFSTLLTANGNLKQLNLIALGGIIVNFGINMLLIPRLQASGAAYASLLTQFFTAGSYLILAQYIFRFKIDYRFVFTLLLFILLVIGFNFISKEFSFHWLVSFSIMLAASLIAAFALKLINIVEIVRLLKEKATL
jgi:O-antigen/teichoic acid export membrane protein